MYADTAILRQSESDNNLEFLRLRIEALEKEIERLNTENEKLQKISQT